MAKPEQSDMRAVGQAWAIGLDVVIYLVAGGLLGYGLDYLFKTGPWLMLILGLLGLASGFTRFIRDAMKLNRGLAGPKGRASGPRDPAE